MEFPGVYRKARFFAAFLIIAAVAGLALPQANAQDYVEIQFKESRTSFPRYTPKHVLAVWVTDANGNFLRTLMRYGSRRVSNLRDWNSVAQDKSVINGMPDVVTGATLRSLSTRTILWELTDTNGNIVPDGEYGIRMELTDHNTNSSSGNNLGFFSFHKNGISSMKTGLSSGGFSNTSINYLASPPPVAPDAPDGGIAPATCTLITSCIDNDGCCHLDCVYEVDNDCSPDTARNELSGCSTSGDAKLFFAFLLLLVAIDMYRRCSL